MQVGKPDARFPCPLLGKVGIHDDPFSRVGKRNKADRLELKKSQGRFSFHSFSFSFKYINNKNNKAKEFANLGGTYRRAFVKTTG